MEKKIVKLAVTSQGTDLDSRVDPSFGRAKYFVLVDAETGEFSAHDNQQNINAAQGAGIQAAGNVAELRAEAVITGSVGPNAFATLHAAGIETYIGAAGSVREAIGQFKDGKLERAGKEGVEGY